MTVEKFIRILGYIAYVALWSPVIVLFLVLAPMVWVVTFVRSGMTVREACEFYVQCLMSGVKHDMEFIRTGVWY